ncbi:MAG: hypothetical protein VKJ06_08800 [Vampirovibrionales bacterium]|nr:hypothetical protein [Vampirovibrionales bacterium]
MQIIFDSMQELEQFMVRFQVGSVPMQSFEPKQGKAAKNRAANAMPDAMSMTKQPGKAAKNKIAKTLPTLTQQVKKTVEAFVSKEEAFSANRVFEILKKKNPDIKKESVIAAVFKLMSSEYKQVPAKLEDGKGPRKIKMYYPQKAA